MTEKKPGAAQEARGGDHPDWASARPGEELGELPGPEAAGGEGDDG